MDKYILVEWPSSQEFMEEEWFASEAILYQAMDEQEELSSAYFIPARRYYDFIEPIIYSSKIEHHGIKYS